VSPIDAELGKGETVRFRDRDSALCPTDLTLEATGGRRRPTSRALRSAGAECLGTDRLHGVAGLSTALVAAVESTGSTIVDPGLGASVPNPPAAILVAGWIVGVIALAVLWAASRR
jgi:hypothetical protein